MSVFNFKQFLSKKSNYEGAQGYAMGQSRAMANCQRAHLTKGKSANDAWMSCQEEFQKSGNKIDWIAAYVTDESIVKGASAQPAQKPKICMAADENQAAAKPTIKIATHMAGSNMSGITDSRAIELMRQNGYRHAWVDVGGSRTLKFTDAEGSLVINPTTRILEKE